MTNIDTEIRIVTRYDEAEVYADTETDSTLLVAGTWIDEGEFGDRYLDVTQGAWDNIPEDRRADVAETINESTAAWIMENKAGDDDEDIGDVEGKRIREILRDNRLERNMGQGAVAEIVGVSVGTIGHWETGRRSPTPENLARWLRAVGMSWGELAEAIEA